MSKTKTRIRESNLRYRHGLGQNFIYDDALLEELVRLSGVGAEDDVLEIGPGSGSMTKHLCRAAHHVLSVELDERLIPLLQAFMAEYDNFSLIQGDVMTLNLKEATEPLRRPFCVVANIPYYITTPLIQLLLTGGLPLKSLSLMVQKEVAEKLLAAPGQEGWGPLAIRAQWCAEVSLLREVPAECFTPAPKVDSAFVGLRIREQPPIAVRSEKEFFRVVNAAFALRRKTMANCLCAAFRMEREEALRVMEAAGLDPRVRGEQLTMDELARVADAMMVQEAAASSPC